ncbi:pentapeptide repeat-containing protein [Neorhizobium sp. BETTINA12A]|uniref:pentapeptide repeat-containing protein n=1 Tax=Neorhizobium sp. BETTINA12A TaxID=2908924 RepID=UPI001FF62602|nr:pentapeptide repeat-containing protein [Neorhizobium sp. BETTINA12A]
MSAEAKVMSEQSPIEVSEQRIGRVEALGFTAAGGPVILNGCILEEADLSGLDLQRWEFRNCRMTTVNLRAADLEGAKFEGCRGPFANFSGANLAEVEFRNCDFNNAAFLEAKMNDTRFVGCKLTGANLTRIASLGLSFKETILAQARLPALSFRKSRIERVDFGMADLSKCDFRDVVFDGCSLRDTGLVDARFEGADLRGADLGGLKLIDARKFKGATISRQQAGDILAELGLKVQ